MATDALGLVGTTIADKYAIESVVGEGGFAVVYRATHVLWKRPVAVKVFKALGEVAERDRKKLLDDFIQEGALLAELSERSSAICQARDVGMLSAAGNANVPYMVLEWLEGKSLEDVLIDERQQGSPLRSLAQTVEMLDPIAEALALAHQNGIAHRDVKPANFFVLTGEGMKLLDFGIAKVVQDAQKMGFGKTAGHITSFTPAYGAPEQFNRAYGATGPWTDVFALALVAVEVVTGREAIGGDTLVQLAYASSDPNTRPTPRALGAAVSDEVEAVFRKALSVKPEERYQTAGEFWTALRMVVIGQPMSGISSERIPSPPSSENAELAAAATALAPGLPAPAPSSSSTTARAPDPNAATALPPSIAVPPAPKKTSLSGGALAGIAIALVVVLGGVGFAISSRKTTTPAATPPPAVSTVASAAAPATCPPSMKRIPGGSFFMGSDEKDAEPNEKPPHKVTLKPYCLDEFEVTVAQYKSCSDRGACLRAAKENDWAGITEPQRKIYDPLCNIGDPKARADHPINCVNYEQARKYCEAQDARLPTEAEWEFAARGSDGRIYPWGDDPPNAQLLNACGKECLDWMKKHPDPDQEIISMFREDDGYPTTAPVGKFPKGKSSWGIQDIAGNVWEWVADWYGPYDPASASTSTSDPNGPDKGDERVIRGGSWNAGHPAWVRPAWRYHVVPTMRTHGIGFRCAKSL
jgi:formylglycine-generating enzyme required for sulfatase activity/tRNA A-37 threonylcarbamoyl transferase component Bud32